ncbi:MAG: Re/Si-specific NAD(P)(+) transhydrogenase subunit alpha [Dehalococcoidia bacterium]|nr:Re/Si-specific NAD(P)(+) transhydrogenase subunit alpha [Dehalococcoidia bacterium]MSQ35356.1 Re/Si-specific NAD(P)(+) transhydrogenase subunit alpha [Dehalococcoidia bacterium]
MKIGAPKETAHGETRVALVPETAHRLARAGRSVIVQAGAGVAAGFPDKAFVDAGAQTVADGMAVSAEADIVIRVGRPSDAEVTSLRSGSVLVAMLGARSDPAVVKALASQGVTAFAMELVPRIARAQKLDVLSSQASIAGYKAALMAANSLGKYFPMLMTAAGTIPPSKVVVLGAGVAGLQAIATARRLGAVVEAYDVRPAVKEQVQSLGAKFIEIPQVAGAEAAGGYAREQTVEEQAKQRELLTKHISEADVVITTAAVPGRKAPVLVTEEMVDAMKPGSVIIDLAAETGGNVAVTRAGQVVIRGGVAVHGPVNLPATMPWHASQLYSRNVMGLLDLIIDKEGNLKLDFNDEVVAGMCVSHAGEVKLK